MKLVDLLILFLVTNGFEWVDDLHNEIRSNLSRIEIVFLKNVLVIFLRVVILWIV